jgi:hypothetical protein
MIPEHCSEAMSGLGACSTEQGVPA